MNKMLVILSMVSSIALAAPGDPPEQVIHDFVRAYAAGDIAAYAGCFSGTATHNGRNFEDQIFDTNLFFRNHSGQRMNLRDVVVSPNGQVTAWMHVESEKTCGGPIDIKINSYGYIQSMYSLCSTDPEMMHQGAGIDHAVLGQGADIATTAAGLAAGLSEANPIVDSVGMPVIAALKFGINEYAETMHIDDCVAVKGALATSGWGAAGWNLCAIATAGTGGTAAIPCAAMGIAAAVIAHNETETDRVMMCRRERAGRRFALIDATGIYEEAQ